MQVAARWRTAALIAAALFAGSIIGPPLVQAATAGLVTIQGANSTNQAQVNAGGQLSVNPNLAKTNASQLLVAEADPAAALYGYLVPAAAVPASIAHAYPKASSLAGLHR